jgi:electron transfer flavoprotein alpha subunit
MRAKHIVAINTNPRAAIFSIADIGAVGDWRGILPPLVAAIRRRLESDRSVSSQI